MDKKEAKGKALRLLEIGTHRVNSVTRNTQCCFQRSEAQIDRRGTFPIALVNIFNFLLIRQTVMSYMQHSGCPHPLSPGLIHIGHMAYFLGFFPEKNSWKVL